MPPSFHPVNGSPLSKALTYISISLGKSTSWIANVRATRSTRPPPKACSRQVSTDETRKQVLNNYEDDGDDEHKGVGDN